MIGNLTLRIPVRLIPIRLLVAMAAISAVSCGPARADNPYLYGIHWWGYSAGSPVDNTPAQLLDAPSYGGWTLETVITHSDSHWQAGFFTGLYADLPQRNVSIITRVDYDWGQTVPSPLNVHYNSWPGTVVATVNTLRQGCHLWLIGNEPNIVGEGGGWPDSEVTPAGYAQIYRNVRNAIRSQAMSSPTGEHKVLVAAPSPGGVITGIRWMDGNQWLGQVLDAIPNNEIDGIAIHAYGGTLSGFESSYREQLQLIDSKGLMDKPVYMTEWNKVSGEATTAQFLRDAFTSVNAWNQTPGNHNIVCMCWFVYDADQQASNRWNQYSIEYYRNNGIAYDPNNLLNGDVFGAFEWVVNQRYPAGKIGIGAPIAEFSGTPLSGRVPLNVQFTDQSTGVISSRTWNFGDGATSNQPSPAHTYTATGIHNVSLYVTGTSGSDTELKTGYITALPPVGDMDNDGDADLTDFGYFQRCMSGSGVPQTAPECLLAKIDGDSDVDLDDLARFKRCLSGAGMPVQFGCAELP